MYYQDVALTIIRRDCFSYYWFLSMKNRRYEIIESWSKYGDVSFSVENKPNTEKIQTVCRISIQNISCIKMMGLTGLLVRDAPEALCCVLEHDTLSAA